MTINFSDPVPDTPPTLACKLGVDGKIRWRDMTACKLTYDDNDVEYVQVFVHKKRELHVVSDQMLRARASMDELPEHLSGLRLSSFPV